MDQKRNSNSKATADNSRGKSRALSDAVYEAGTGGATFNRSWIGLGIALRPLLDKAAHSIALEILNERPDSPACLKLAHEATSNLGVLGSPGAFRHGCNSVE